MKKDKHRQHIKSFPYYKVQYWSSYVSAWVDIQKQFKTEALARQFIRQQKGSLKYRVMRIHRTSREVI